MLRSVRTGLFSVRFARNCYPITSNRYDSYTKNGFDEFFIFWILICLAFTNLTQHRIDVLSQKISIESAVVTVVV